ncbi:peptidoglycan-binding domain-containing protein [Ralstonia pseudosolanacearum]|uniref:peptidoglycan-binding domain-containing protein n=1 Tax=Ralstonia pseudosolanacearum TaxID=1310165 RepID=UPI003394D71C
MPLSTANVPPRAPRGPYGTGARNTHPLLSTFRASDGSFGAETESRVRAFQRRSMLVPDGIVGPQELGGT